MPRPGVVVRDSNNGRGSNDNGNVVTQLHQKTLYLEEELIALGKNPPDGITVPIRVKLCEAFCDIILFDAHFADDNDCIGRLWRHCFYNRMTTRRTKLMKTQRKVEQLQASIITMQQQQQNNVNADNDDDDGINTASASLGKYTKITTEIKSSLNEFLSEGVTMYHFLCDKLQLKLLRIVKPNSALLLLSSSPPSQSQDSRFYDSDRASGAVPASPNGTEYSQDAARGIVECIRRLYIHLGDLYRYGEQYDQADLMYGKSQELGPGYGHAYNQLAVSCQTKVNSSTKPGEQQSFTAVALYWYTRSLLASRECFVTAETNMKRLLMDNRTWLQQEKQHYSSSTTKKDTAITASSKSSNNSNSSRQFLANFVDLHYEFFLMTQQQPSSSVDHAGVVSIKTLENTIGAVCHGLKSLLKNSAFSDKLLCQLVTIQAFSVHYYNNNNITNNNDNAAALTSSSSPAKQYYAQLSTFMLGECLAERVYTIVTKQLTQLMSNSNINNSSTSHQQQPPPPPLLLPSTRVLLPLLIITEYLFDLTKTGQLDVGVTNSTKVEEFWQLIVLIANQLREFALIFKLIPLVYDGNNNEDNDDDDNQNKHLYFKILKEYQTLRGYGPFQSFLQPLNDDGNLPDVEAADLLDSTDETNKQQSSSMPSTTSGNRTSQQQQQQHDSSSIRVTGSHQHHHAVSAEQQNRYKVIRFLSLAKIMSESPDLNIQLRQDGTYVWTDKPIQNEENIPPEIMASPTGSKDGKGDDIEINNEYTGEFDLAFDSHTDDDNDDVGGGRDNMFNGDDDVAMENLTSAFVHSVDNEDNAQLTLHDAGSNNDSAGALTYKCRVGGGPPILVPGDLLQEHHTTASVGLLGPFPGTGSDSSPTNHHHSGSNILHSSNVEHIIQQHGLGPHHLPQPQPFHFAPAIVPPAIALPPPPGFGRPLDQSKSVFPANSESVSHPDPRGQEPHHTYMDSSFNAARAGITGNNVIEDPRLAESVTFFGGPQAFRTANPFADEMFRNPDANFTLGGGERMTSNPSHHHNTFLDDPFADDGLWGNGGAKLVDSNILSSLFMGDEKSGRKSDNPFAM